MLLIILVLTTPSLVEFRDFHAKPAYMRDAHLKLKCKRRSDTSRCLRPADIVLSPVRSDFYANL